MIYDRIGASFCYEGVTYAIGAKVIATAESEYEGLYGTIIEIRTDDDRETENDTPDIYCEFLPPVLPSEIEALQDRFFALYMHPKKLEEISLDLVIMAPEMIRLITTGSRHTATVYLVREQWAIDGNSGEDIFPALDPDHAKMIFTEQIRNDMEEGCLSRWTDRSNIEKEISDRCFECWLRDSYFENHFKVTIEEHALQFSADTFAAIGNAYIDHQLRAHFAEQIEDWDEISDLSPTQLTELISLPCVPEQIRKQLNDNGYLVESYWESVSEVAFRIVMQYIKQINAGGTK